jgi:SAM-dependent methyltransferase
VEKQKNTRSCRLCRATDYEYLFQTRPVYNNVSLMEYDVVRCRRCTLIYVIPDPPIEDIEKLYQGADYLEELFQDQRWQNWIIRTRWTPILEQIEKFCGVGKMLDVGCSDGLFLKVAKDRGWKAHGIDINKASSEAAWEKYKVPVKVASVDNMDWPDGFFDVVRMSNILEHLVDPMSALMKVQRTIRPGGLISVDVPNFDLNVYELVSKIPSRKLFNRLVRFFGWVDPPHHLQSWSSITLRKALALTEFEPVWQFAHSHIMLYIPNYRKGWLGSKLFSLPLRVMGSGMLIDMLGRKTGNSS